jgi:hypothetical protein
MPLRCRSCAQLIVVDSGQRLPPWCQKCGADLKFACEEPPPSETSAEPPPVARAEEPPRRPEVVHAAPLPAAMDDSACPGCGVQIEIADFSGNVAAYCSDCGQCLKAPAPWSPARAEQGRPRLSPTCAAAGGKVKLPGQTGIILGVVIAGFPWALAGLPVALQLTATMFGAALVVEGLGRICDEVWRDAAQRPAASLEISQELAADVEHLGSLQAVYRTGNRWSDSLALLFLAAGCAMAEIGVLQWLRDEQHPKLFFVALALPFLAVYLLYRAGRNLWERGDVLIFQHGLAFVRRRRAEIYPWNKIEAVRHEEIGDAIDEEAVEVRLKYGMAPLRFTYSHFHNLAQFRAQLEHAFSGSSEHAAAV